MSEQKDNLRNLLNQMKREMSGYLLACNPGGKPTFTCKAWWTETGLWLHGYGDSEEEAVQDCLIQVLEFKEGFN